MKLVVWGEILFTWPSAEERPEEDTWTSLRQTDSPSRTRLVAIALPLGWAYILAYAVFYFVRKKSARIS